MMYGSNRNGVGDREMLKEKLREKFYVSFFKTKHSGLSSFFCIVNASILYSMPKGNCDSG